MARSDQTEDAAELEATGDASPVLPAVPDDADTGDNGDAPALMAPDEQPALPTADEQPTLPAADEQPGLPAGDEQKAAPAADELGGADDAAPATTPVEADSADNGAAAHNLLAPVEDKDVDARGRKPPKPPPAPEPLVSGDPLLLGPRPKSAPEPAKQGAAGPPKPAPAPPAGPAPAAAPSVFNDESLGMRRPTVDPGVGAMAGIAAPASGQTARRASRGAHASAEHAAVPPVRSVPPQQQPTATLRPTTVAPVPRLAGRRPRVRRVTRIVRHIDPWSMFKVAAAFSAVAYAIALVAGVLLWNVAYATGTIDNIERGMESTGWETFELDGGEIFHNAWIGGLFVAVGLTGLAVLAATLFNLITDLVGGIRLTVLEEEVIEKTASPMRRFATRRDAPSAEERVRRARSG